MVLQLVFRQSLTAVSLITGTCKALDRGGQIAVNTQAWRDSKAKRGPYRELGQPIRMIGPGWKKNAIN